MRLREGWAFTIDGVAQLAAIDGRFERYLPRNGTFLVLLGRVRNYTDKSGCIGGEDFLLRGETQEYPMSPEIVRTVRAIYEIDYPDFVVGQCLDYDKEKASCLVFDVPLSDEVLGRLM